VYGPRGGVGTTFVATHLAAAFAHRGMETVLVDADTAFGDLTWALGVPPDGDARTMAELEPVSEEISEEHLRNVLWPHPSGLRAILAPRDTRPVDVSKAPCEAVRVASGMTDVVTVHLPRAIDSSVSELVQVASVLLVVVTLDVFAFRDAKRALEALEFGGKVEFVVNRAARGLIARSDVERVFGKPALCVLPFERRVRDAQDRGELLPSRSRMGRAFGRLASALLEEAG